MSAETDIRHQAVVIEQFSEQAIPFARLPAHLDAIDRLLALARIAEQDRVLDVACGPGLVATACAAKAQWVEGLDITPAMLAEAKQQQQTLGLDNLSWTLGDAQAMPYEDAGFDCVLTRYSFHHLQQPETVFAQMCRVCKPGGRVLVADVCVDAARQARYNTLEQLRDASHTSALSREQFEALFLQQGLQHCRREDYRVTMPLQQLLAASSTPDSHQQRLQQALTEDVGRDESALAPEFREGVLWVNFPISIYVGDKPL